MKPKFIVLEGSEGVGKTTNMLYLCALLKSANIPYILTREPGGTPVGEKIRAIVLGEGSHIDNEAELLLMMAARKQHIAEVIQPALAAGKWVLCDRFVDSSYAYQGYGRGIPLARIDVLAEWTVGSVQPDMVLILDAPLDTGMARIGQRSKDRIEQEGTEFFERVRQGFLARAKNKSHYQVINAAQPLDAVQQDIRTCLGL